MGKDKFESTPPASPLLHATPELKQQRGRRGPDQVRMAAGRVVSRRQALVCARLPAHAGRHGVGRDPRGAAHGLRAARQGELDRRCVCPDFISGAGAQGRGGAHRGRAQAIRRTTSRSYTPPRTTSRCVWRAARMLRVSLPASAHGGGVHRKQATWPSARCRSTTTDGCVLPASRVLRPAPDRFCAYR